MEFLWILQNSIEFHKNSMEYGKKNICRLRGNDYILTKHFKIKLHTVNTLYNEPTVP
jgi:hypothetical protein